jgi:lipopolysaccharide export system permease protein
MTMLGILSRYIAWRMLLTVAGVFGLCLVLIFMIDMVELMRIAGSHGSISVLSVVWIGLLRLPSFAELTLPFAVLAGSIGTFLMLSRSSELVVTRAAGMSVWQFLLPAVVVAILLGVAGDTIYNPFAATVRAASETAFAKTFGEEVGLMTARDSQMWLRQDGVDGSSIVNAAAAADQGRSLSGLRIIQYNTEGKFTESIQAQKGILRDGFWELTNVIVTRPRAAPEQYASYLVSTYLSPTEVQETLGSEFSVSFWQLPSMIAVAEKAGLPAKAFRLQYAMLLVRPFLFAVMVLLAATVSLKTFRMGNIQTKVVVGLLSGFGFFILAEVSRQLGMADLVPTVAAVGLPVALGGSLSLTVLLHQEDG